MSIMSYLFILILGLSMHACNARSLGVIHERGFGGQLHIVRKVGENVRLGMNSAHTEAADREFGITDRGHGDAVPQKAKEMKYSEKTISGVVPIKSLVSVSWHVPHKNRDKHPGFYSDYSRPRTRPPSHN